MELVADVAGLISLNLRGRSLGIVPASGRLGPRGIDETLDD